MHFPLLKIFAVPVLLLLVTGCGSGEPSATKYAAQVKRESQSCPCIYVANVKHNRKANADAITVYPIGAKNNATPIQYITGSKTGLFRPSGVAADGNGYIYVSNHYGIYTGEGTVTIYLPGSSGNVTPFKTIGPFPCCSGLEFPGGIALDPTNGDIYVSNEGSRGYCAGSVAFFSATGNELGNLGVGACPSGLVLDPAGNIYVPTANAYGSYGNCNGSQVCGAIEIYAAGSSGYKKPTVVIAGPNTGLYYPSQLALDSSLNVYAANYGNNSVTVYAAGSTGDSAPVQTISGSNTQLDDPSGIALDPSGNIYVSNHDNAITVYGAGANGNAAPSRRIKGVNTHLHYPEGIVIR